MTYILWILIFLFSGIFLLALSILLYHPNEYVKDQNSEKHKIDEHTTESISFAAVLQQQLDEIQLCYPDLATMVERYDFPHCILFHNRGVSKNKNAIFISICRDDCKTACLNAITRLYETNQKLDIDFWVSLVVNSHYELEAGNECYEFLKNKGVHLFGALMDGSDNEHLFSNASYQALIGVSTGCLIDIQVNGNLRKVQKWIDELDGNKIFVNQMNPKLKQTIHALRNRISIPMRLKLTLFPQKGMEDLIHMIPFSWSWMKPSVEKKKDSIILRAPNEKMLLDAYQILEKKAANASLYLSQNNIIREVPFVETDEAIYQRISKAILASQKIKGIVPVTIPESTFYGHYPDWKVCRYMPLYENEKKSSDGAVQFYYNVLTQPKSIEY